MEFLGAVKNFFCSNDGLEMCLRSFVFLNLNIDFRTNTLMASFFFSVSKAFAAKVVILVYAIRINVFSSNFLLLCFAYRF